MCCLSTIYHDKWLGIYAKYTPDSLEENAFTNLSRIKKKEWKKYVITEEPWLVKHNTQLSKVLLSKNGILPAFDFLANVNVKAAPLHLSRTLSLKCK